MKLRYDALPEHMQDAMQRWIEDGIEPGDFLTSVLCNDLMGAFGKADGINRERLKDYCTFLYNYAPSQCHGSPAKVAAWRAKGGLFGDEESAA